jgi:hypothetical protein
MVVHGTNLRYIIGHFPIKVEAARAYDAEVRRRGRAVQVDPINPTVKPPGTKRLKLQYHDPPSNFAFKFHLGRYTAAGRSSSGSTSRTRRRRRR